MNALKTLLLGMVLCSPVLAEQLVAPVDLADFYAAESITRVDDTMRIEAVPGKNLQTLLAVTDPGITSPVYALKGMLRYEGVEGDAYLHLDSHFEGVGTFFTKTLAPSGPLQTISGTSGWRPFALPFYANQGDQADGRELRPDTLTLHLYLPGSGVVELRELALYQYEADENVVGAATFSGATRAATLVGAIGGTLVGLWGALAGFLVSRGKARTFVLGSASLLIVAGAVLLATGIFAVIDGQPYAVYYPLLLFGGILVVAVGIIRAYLPRRYEAVELQKMQSLDA